MSIPLRCCVLLVGFLLAGSASGWACIWDSKTPATKKNWNRPAFADLILRSEQPKVDQRTYQKKLDSLLTAPHPEDVTWLNEVAGTYLRKGEAQKAVDLLAPREAQFTNDYGVQANLGTAYHLLGRYEEAERHIARDLEINPEAHFGLEKFHLALLQYLVRDVNWKKERVFVDEFSTRFYLSEGRVFGVGRRLTPENDQAIQRLSTKMLPYRAKWILDQDPHLTDGLLYMAELNRTEPAVYEMLGVMCWKKGDRNLAAASFAKAISLGSPKSATLRVKIDSILGSKAEVRP